jgi:nucleolin
MKFDGCDGCFFFFALVLHKLLNYNQQRLLSTMESTILSVLQSKGSLKEKKLLKKVSESYEQRGKTFDEDKFSSALSKLMESKEVLRNNDKELTLNKVQVTLKRTRNEDDEDDDVKTTNEESKKRNKKSKKSKDEEEEETSGESKEEGKKSDETEDLQSKKRWSYPDLWKNGEKFWRENTFDPEYLRTNPDRITRLFCGNLSRKITEEDLMARIEGINYIKWITDKQTGEFYGSSFLDMKDPSCAAAAVMQDKSKFMGRPLKIYYCPPRPGDVWPPHEARGGNNKKGATSGGNNPPGKQKSEKPEGCCKLFIGNLSYDIDDDTIVDFFKDCGTLIGLRWLTRQETGEFRVSVYVAIWTIIIPNSMIKCRVVDMYNLLRLKKLMKR